MYKPGTLVYFKPFYFPDGGAKPKQKYFLTLVNDGENLVVASLPSSQDFVPANIEKEHGCLNYPEGDFNAYYFDTAFQICTNG